MKRREYYTWLRLLRLPLTVHIEPLRFTIGVAVYKCIDGSGRHSYCYRTELSIPVVRFETVIKFGPRPIPPRLEYIGGFGNIGGKSVSERHRAIAEYDADGDDEE